MVVESRPPRGSGNVAPPDGQRQTPAGRRFEIQRLGLPALGMGRVGMKPHESAAWLYGFLTAVRSGDLYAPPHVVEMVERALERYERTRATREEWGLARYRRALRRLRSIADRPKGRQSLALLGFVKFYQLFSRPVPERFPKPLTLRAKGIDSCSYGDAMRRPSIAAASLGPSGVHPGGGKGPNSSCGTPAERRDTFV